MYCWDGVYNDAWVRELKDREGDVVFDMVLRLDSLTSSVRES